MAPVLEAARARNIVEIGALRGENTRQIIDRLGPETVLHVIDPLPDFDPAAHEREFAGQYVFHRDLSLNVLGDLAPMDAALVDGDHNWYTVLSELRLLREVARNNGAPMPLLILHDVGWPYGRRDLYYDPTNIPDEFRREWAHKGMEPDKVMLVPFGAGLNPKLANAMVEGGRRNGVRTALDDFVAEHDRPARQVVLPVYFGLAIVAEEELLRREPALAAALDRLESPEGKDELLQVAEDIRLEGLIFQHRIYYDRDRSTARLARRYLDGVMDGPVAEDAGRSALEMLESSLDDIRDTYVMGDVVTVGLDRSGASVFARCYLEAYELWGRQTWAYGDVAGTKAVADGLERLRLDGDRTQMVELPDGAPRADSLPDQVAVLRVGEGLGADPTALLDSLYERLDHEGLVQVEAGAAARAAADGLAQRVGAADRDDDGAWRKAEQR